MDYTKILESVLNNPENVFTDNSKVLLESLKNSLSVDYKKFIDGDVIVNGEFEATVISNTEIENKTFVIYSHNGVTDYIDNKHWKSKSQNK